MSGAADDPAFEVARLRRQIAQFGFDLHDDALQDVTALRNDLARFQTQLEVLLAESPNRRKVVGRIDDFLARVGKLDAGLRRLAVTGRLPPPPPKPLAQLLADSVETHADAGTAYLVLAPDLDVDGLANEERSAIVRVVESALANVRQHGGEATVRITARTANGVLEVEVLDDGRGFDVEESRRRAARENRLGLLGMEERMASVGGTFSITSRPGGPTRITLRLPRPGHRSSEL